MGFFDRLLQPRSGEGSLKWYRVSSAAVLKPGRYGLTCCDQRTWIFVFQYIPISFIVAVATDITQATGTYCVNGHGVHFAHIWVRVCPPSIGQCQSPAV